MTKNKQMFTNSNKVHVYQMKERIWNYYKPLTTEQTNAKETLKYKTKGNFILARENYDTLAHLRPKPP